MLVGDASARGLLAGVLGPQDTARQQVVQVEVVEIGRRRMPSEGVRAQSVDRERGVNDPGAAWPVRPQALLCWGSFTPHVSMSDEARA
jgi:hypothetical protein